jgi:hypothetical protein
MIHPTLCAGYRKEVTYRKWKQGTETPGLVKAWHSLVHIWFGQLAGCDWLELMIG